MQHLGGNEHGVALALWQESRAPFSATSLSSSPTAKGTSQGAFFDPTLTESSFLVLADHHSRQRRSRNSSAAAGHLPKDTALGPSDWRQARDTERKRNARLALSRPGTSEVPKPTPLLFKTLGARPALSRRLCWQSAGWGRCQEPAAVPGLTLYGHLSTLP